MTAAHGPEALLAALDQRLREAARVLLPGTEELGPLPTGHAAGHLLPLLVDAAREHRSTPETWLLVTATQARFPTAAEVRSVVRAMRVSDPAAIATRLLDEMIRRPERGRPHLEMDLVVDGVVVNANGCAHDEHNTGIQRVVRRTLPIWRASGRSFVTTAWTDSRDGARTLSRAEDHRVFAHSDVPAVKVLGKEAARHTPRLVVPWRSTLVCVEVPVGQINTCLPAIGELSGNVVSFIGYDAIPIVNADIRPALEGNLFAAYLASVKHGHHVAGISVSAATEFSGFVDALSSQGLPGPSVVEVMLPGEAPERAAGAARRAAKDASDRVSVLCVGSKELHKNHRGVLHAAERLWREGLDFDLTFAGGFGHGSEGFEAYFDRLAAAGRPLRHLGRVTDAELTRTMTDADFTVFLSFQEGYGLPVAESLSCGTPVLTANYGSLAEVAAGGGALLANPRDDDDIATQFRRLVLDADLRDRLAAEALARPVRTWDDYADELWEALVTAPTRARVAG